MNKDCLTDQYAPKCNPNLEGESRIKFTIGSMIEQIVERQISRYQIEAVSVGVRPKVVIMVSIRCFLVFVVSRKIFV